MIPGELFSSALRTLLAPIVAYLDDPSVSEIMINGPGAVFVERKGKLEQTPAEFGSDEAILAALRNVAQFSGGFVDAEHPVLEAQLPDGSRLTAVVAPIARGGPLVSIRRSPRTALDLDQLVERQSLTADAAEALVAMAQAGCTLVIAGGTASGKTSLLAALAAAMPAGERMFVLEETREIHVAHEHVAYLTARMPDDHGELGVPTRDVVQAALRMRPDRVIVGELRGDETLDLVQAAVSGHACLATLRAGSPNDAVTRLQTLCMKAEPSIPLPAIRAEIAAGIDAVVQVSRLPDGRRGVTRIAEIAGLDRTGRHYEIRDLFTRTKDHPGSGGGLRGPLLPTRVVPGFLPKLEAHGLSLPAAMGIADNRMER